MAKIFGMIGKALSTTKEPDTVLEVPSKNYSEWPVWRRDHGLLVYKVEKKVDNMEFINFEIVLQSNKEEKFFSLFRTIRAKRRAKESRLALVVAKARVPTSLGKPKQKAKPVAEAKALVIVLKAKLEDVIPVVNGSTIGMIMATLVLAVGGKESPNPRKALIRGNRSQKMASPRP